MTVRGPYRWLLGGTLVLTVVALLWTPEPAVPPVVVEARQVAGASDASPLARPASSTTRKFQQVSEDDARLLPANTDPFAAPRAAQAAERTVPVSVPRVAEPVPPAPATPALPPPPPTPRFAGRMLTPEGQWVLYLRDGDQTVVAATGGVLPSGYQVEAVKTHGQGESARIASVSVLHTASQHRAEIALPPLETATATPAQRP